MGHHGHHIQVITQHSVGRTRFSFPLRKKNVDPKSKQLSLHFRDFFLGLLFSIADLRLGLQH